MSIIILTINTVLPVFLIVLLGLILKKVRILDDDYIKVSSNLAFKVALPTLCFLKIATTRFYSYFNLELIGFIYSCTILSFLMLWLFSKPIIHKDEDRAVFIQGAFRSNFAIVGFAIILNTLGPEALSIAAIILAFIMPLYNVLSVVALSIPTHKIPGNNLKKTAYGIMTNPLILAVIAALPFSVFQIELPYILLKSAEYLSSLALPLALLSIGGSLVLNISKRERYWVSLASCIKIIIIPILFTLIAYKMGYTGTHLGVLFILFGCPSAVVSFAMAEAMNCNGKMASSIITVTTFGSIITVSAGIIVGKSAGIF